jgi:alpha-N-arabinofuranosidase
MELCRQIGCEPYINGNVGSGTVQEMGEWVEYMTFDGVSPMAELRAENGRKEPWKVKYWGIGNENWGCGGNMRPEYYADVYRRFQTYIRSFGDNKICKIACGSSGFDYDWTEIVMQIAGKFMDAVTLHHYTIPGNWSNKGSATDFSQDDYYLTISKALKMEELISNHLQIMNRYDPDHRVGLIVDEWGTWYNVEPGTNPGFLYQQNTMRDAIVASTTLDIFNKYSNRIVMANIAQTINVLQAVILTEGDKMLLTPTYHVFDLYKNHHDATLLGLWLESGESGSGVNHVPHLSATASEKDGQITLTATNISTTEPASVNCSIDGINCVNIKGRILAGSIDDKNDFNTPNHVTVKPYTDMSGRQSSFGFELPPCSVVEIVL